MVWEIEHGDKYIRRKGIYYVVIIMILAVDTYELLSVNTMINFSILAST